MPFAVLTPPSTGLTCTVFSIILPWIVDSEPACKQMIP